MFATKILEERKSRFNGSLCVVRTWGMGTYIQAEGLTQSGGIVESIWKKTLRKVKGKRHEVKDVLILGLGGGTAAKLIHKSWPQAKITGVDIDPVMTELGEKYLKLNRGKTEIQIGDAYDFLTQRSKLKTQKYNSKLKNSKYDLIIVDLYNGDKFPKKFTFENYIHLVRNNLSRSGIAIFNRLYFKDRKIEAEEFGKKLEKVFGKVKKIFPEANVMFVCSR